MGERMSRAGVFSLDGALETILAPEETGEFARRRSSTDIYFAIWVLLVVHVAKY